MHDIERVVEGGYCIGCGACALAQSSPAKMQWNQFGQLQATFSSPIEQSTGEAMDMICPFTNKGPNEDEIISLVKDDAADIDPSLGAFLSILAGHVEEGAYRAAASSGGYATWIASELLKQGLVDYVIHVGPSSSEETLFSYKISETYETVQGRSKTRYYPVEMSQVLSDARARGGRFALIGVPCFIKAARRLAETDAKLKSQMNFTIAIICGHHKSAAFAESLAWQAGVRPGQVETVDFRRKSKGQPANRYSFAATEKASGREVTRPMSSMVGASWAFGAFRAKACDYCDDVVGETADVSIGDAWLPAYVKDSMGSNVIVIRNSIINHLTKRAIAEGRLSLDPLSPDDAIKSQAAGFRHRREGLKYRLWLQDRAGRWRPQKRIDASNGLNKEQKIKFRMRIYASAASHQTYLMARKSKFLSIYTKSFTIITSFFRPILYIVRKF